MTLNKLNEVDLEKEYLAKLPDLNALLDSLKSKNYMLVSKVKSLEDELVWVKLYIYDLSKLVRLIIFFFHQISMLS